MTTRSRRSAAAAFGLLLLIGAALWLGGAFEPRAAEDLPEPGRDAASGVLSTGDLAEADGAGRGSELVAAQSWDLPGVDVRPAVRLPGDGRLRGRVLDRSTQRGVSDLRVDLLPVTPSARDFLSTILRMARATGGMGERARPVAVTRSGQGGSFAFEGVRAGTYFLDPRGEAHVPDGPVRVRVMPSGAGGPVEVWVRPGARIVGQVLLADGRPARRARVALFPGAGDVLRAFRTGDLRRVDALCDAQGRFDLAGVAPGTDYELHAFGPGLVLSHAVVPPLEAGSEVEVIVRGRAAGALRGRIVAAAENGELVPVAGAELGVLPRGLRDMQFSEEVLAATAALSGETGDFRVTSIPPGEVELLVVAPGHVARATEPVRVAGGAEVDLGDIVVEAAGVLRGHVVDEAGEPLSGVSVRWFLGRMRDPRHMDVSFAPFVLQSVGNFAFPESDSEGRFVAGPFPGEPPHSLYLAKEGYPYTRAVWNPEQGDELEVVLTAGGAVEGLVVDASTGAPVTAFHVTGTDRIDVDYREPSSFNPFSGDLLFEGPEGRFRLEAVRAGEAQLTFRAPGYQPRRLIGLDVRSGETLGGLLVELVSGGVVRGRILDAAGEPVAGAQVGALAGGNWSIDRTFGRLAEHFNSGTYRDSPEEGTSNAILSFATRMGVMGREAVLTEPDGAFELSGLGPGNYSVVARHRDHALARSEPFDLGEGESRDGLELVMTEGASLWGEIADSDGRPLPGATLLAISPTEFSGDHSAEAAVYQGVADATGMYEVRHMAGGSYFLTVMRADGELNPASLFGTLQLDMITVPPGRRVQHDVEDASAGACRVYGRVVESADGPTGAGRITSFGGSVLAVGLEADNLIGLDFKMARVDTAGNYEFPGLASGAYEFTYQSPLAEIVVAVEVPDAFELEVDLELPSGQITGRVVASDTGSPLPGATVILLRTKGKRPDQIFGAFLPYQPGAPKAETDRDGFFRVPNRLTGNWRLVVEPPESGPLAGRYARLGGLPIEVPDSGGLELAIELEPALTVAGRVTDATGAPVAEVEVSAFDDAAAALRATWTRTDEEGRYQLVDLAAGSWSLRFAHPEFAEAAHSIQLADSALEGIDARLEQGGQLVLRVRDERGAPVVGAVARVAPAAADAAASGPGNTLFRWFLGASVSDASGRLDAGRFAPGLYRVEVRHGGRTSVLEAVELGPSGTAELDVRVE